MYVHIIDQARGEDGWILAEFSFCVFMDLDFVSVHKNLKGERKSPIRKGTPRSLKGIDSEKAPGTDRLPAEGYKTFWDELAFSLISAPNYAFDQRTLSVSQRGDIIKLIPKQLFQNLSTTIRRLPKGPIYWKKQYTD